MASNAIKIAVNGGVVKAYDESAGNKFKEYILFWADSYDE